jgi:hypothetical protein
VITLPTSHYKSEGATNVVESTPDTQKIIEPFIGQSNFWKAISDPVDIDLQVHEECVAIEDIPTQVTP